MRKKKIKALSLFANVGIAECYFSQEEVEVVVANELIPVRAKFYKHVYPDTNMIIGDITNKDIFEQIIDESKKEKINLIIATPPCQGMSTAGKKQSNDERNYLIKAAVEAIKILEPEYVMLENVPEQFSTYIEHCGEKVLILDYIKQELGNKYYINKEIVNSADYGVPQLRERAIMLFTRQDKNIKWNLPKKEDKRYTLEDAIGKLPILDPFIYDMPYEEMIHIFPEYEKNKKLAEKISKWHTPPKHVYRQVYAMQHTPTGKSAFENEDGFKPKKKTGETVRGYKNTYKRQNWNTPAYTVTMYNRTIGSQNNVHPGRFIGKDKDGNDIYSDPRVLTVYEIMLIMSIPETWNIPDWATENLVRSVIGEGIPPLLTKKIMRCLPDEI